MGDLYLYIHIMYVKYIIYNNVYVYITYVIYLF